MILARCVAVRPLYEGRYSLIRLNHHYSPLCDQQSSAMPYSHDENAPKVLQIRGLYNNNVKSIRRLVSRSHSDAPP